MRINVKKERGKRTVSREDGMVIANKLMQAMENEDNIIIDFDNILIASVSFFDEAFGKLAFKYPKDVLVKRLLFENIEPYDRALLNDILISRYHQREMEQKKRSKAKARKASNGL
ncbi:MAG: STAS-like domain-containing protein [Syntrophorhabdaceae bacterium]|nr:STAS-like domain-containing protein [Syntrophorhabdaceae bacterium]